MHSKWTRTREVWKKCRKSLTLYTSNNLGLAYKHTIEINSLSVIPSCIYSQMEFLFLQRNTHIDFSKTLKYLMWIRNTNTKYPNNLHLHIFSERWKPPLVNIEIDCWEMWFQWYNTISIYHNCHIYDVINHLSRTNRTKSIMYVFHIHPHSKSEKEECIMSFL